MAKALTGTQTFFFKSTTMLSKLLIWIDMKTKWSFIAVALTALLSVTPAAVQANTSNESFS
ncbi:MAG: hypothetical protein ACRC1W_00760, partial [Shewanella sp.]